MTKRFFHSVLAVLVVACSGQGDTGTDQSGGAIANADAGPACQTATDTHATDASSCIVKRGIFRCADEASVSICLADIEAECVVDPRNRGPGFACEGFCTPGEYAISCINDVGVPDACREIFPDGPHPVTGGGALWCCPCL